MGETKTRLERRESSFGSDIHVVKGGITMRYKKNGSASVDQYREWEKVVKLSKNVIWVKEKGENVKRLVVGK